MSEVACFCKVCDLQVAHPSEKSHEFFVLSEFAAIFGTKAFASICWVHSKTVTESAQS